MSDITAAQRRPALRRLLLSPEEKTASHTAALPPQTAPRRLRADRAAAWAVSGGGMVIIASILGILAFILLEVWPLLRGAEVTAARETALRGGPAQALLGDEHRTHIVALGVDGAARAIRLADGALVAERLVAPPPLSNRDLDRPLLVRIANPPGSELLAVELTPSCP